MEEDIVCTECGSSNILFSNKRQLYICEDCAHQFTPRKASDKRRIFISYGHDEYASFALRLKKDLEDLGYEAWFDLERIKCGGDWERYIEDGLEWVSEYRDEGRFLLLMTPHSVRKPDGYCLNELARALQRRLNIIPVMVLTSEFPTPIRHFKWLDMRDCLPVNEKEAQYHLKLGALIDAIEKKELSSQMEAGDISPPEDAVEDTVPGTATKRVYIGHGAGEHTGLARQLKKDLESRGIKAWLDIDSQDSGHDISIEEGLSWAAEVPEEGRYILLMTPHSVRRPDGQCLNELARARKMKLRVIPVMVSWCEPPLSICRTQWLDMQDCVPVEQKGDKYRVKLGQLIDVLETGRLDHEGVQARLLHILEPLPFDADISRHVQKFKGRKWALEKIDGWLDDRGTGRIMLVMGLPGSGKSAIAAWLCYHRPEVAAFHICKYNDARRSDDRRFIESIAYQLSTQLPDYQAELNRLDLESIVQGPDAREHFRRLIVEPLSRVTPKGRSQVLAVLDSLDQAGDSGLARLIASEFLKTPSWLRLLITSRPDPCIMDMLQGIDPYVLDLSTGYNEEDLRSYVREELYAKFSGPSGPVDRAVDAVVAKSEGSMLYADVMCRELAQGRLALDKLDEFPKALGGAYAEFFARQFPDIEEYKARYRPVLEAIAAAQEPIDLGTLGRTMDMNMAEITKICDALGSLFPRTDDKIRPFHRSLVDWLIYADRAGPYFVSVGKGHKRLADHGMSEYRTGVKSMSQYMLAHLPEHLLKAGRIDDLRTLVSDLAYLDRVEETDAKSIGDIARYRDMAENVPDNSRSDIARML